MPQNAGGGASQQAIGGGIYIAPGLAGYGEGPANPPGDTSTFSSPGPAVSPGPEVGPGPQVGEGPQVGSDAGVR